MGEQRPEPLVCWGSSDSQCGPRASAQAGRGVVAWSLSSRSRFKATVPSLVLELGRAGEEELAGRRRTPERQGQPRWMIASL